MGTIPFSNPAGNNQTNPGSPAKPMNLQPVGNIPGSPSATQNPYSPPGTVPGAGGVPNVGGLTNSPSNVAGTTGGLNKQLIDIWGKGVGGALGSLLEGMSGTDSQILQEFIASLGPQMATAQSNVNAALGAGGVSSNSSVAGIADANLQAQEFGAISSEEVSLTQSQEQMTANILMGLTGPAAKEVATSGWSTFADVINNITGDVGNLVGGSYQSPQPGAGMGAPMMQNVTAPGQLPFGQDATMSQPIDTSSLGTSPDLTVFNNW